MCESKNVCLFTEQTTVKSIKVPVLFQDAEVTCKICKMDFNDEINKITLGKRGSVPINYANVQRGEDLRVKTGDHAHAHRRHVCTNKSVTAVKLMKIIIVSPSKKRRMRLRDSSFDSSQRSLFCGHHEEIVKKGAKKR